jgi:GNAT superfamily N-acetyltransferase
VTGLAGSTPARPLEWRRDRLVISTDPTRLDRALIHRFLSERSYWARGIPASVVERSIANSLNFGVYDGHGAQLGYTRVITDRATFAFLRDVFIVEDHRGEGLGTWLVDVVVSHPDLQGLRRVLLATRDAHRLYARLGFRPLKRPDRFLAIETPTKELYPR